CLAGNLGGCSRAGAIDPDFGGDGLQGKADPERGAEELMQVRSMPANHRGGEKGSHDRADGGDSEPDGVAANHPLAMLRKFAPQRVPKRLRKRNQEETPEQRNGGLFIDAPDGFSKGQSQSSDSHDGAGDEKDSSRPAVNLRRARAHGDFKPPRVFSGRSLTAPKARNLCYSSSIISADTSY